MTYLCYILISVQRFVRYLCQNAELFDSTVKLFSGKIFEVGIESSFITLRGECHVYRLFIANVVGRSLFLDVLCNVDCR